MPVRDHFASYLSPTHVAISDPSLSTSRKYQRESTQALETPIQVKSSQVKSISLHAYVSIIGYVGGIINILALPNNPKEKNPHQLRVHCTAPAPSPQIRPLSTINRRRLRLHLNPILRRFVRHRPLAIVEGILSEVVVVDSLAHAVHDDGAVDDLGEGADTTKRKQGQSA
jgi:hypothetical protein